MKKIAEALGYGVLFLMGYAFGAVFPVPGAIIGVTVLAWGVYYRPRSTGNKKRGA